MTALADSSLAFARDLRDEALGPALEVFDDAVTREDRWAAACELCLTSRSANLAFDVAVAKAGMRMQARDRDLAEGA